MLLTNKTRIRTTKESKENETTYQGLGSYLLWNNLSSELPFNAREKMMKKQKYIVQNRKKYFQEVKLLSKFLFQMYLFENISQYIDKFINTCKYGKNYIQTINLTIS